jgi:DNA polymerase III subunit delta
MIFLLHGKDSFRRQTKIKELKEKFMTAVDPLGQSFSFIDGSKSSLAELNDQLSGGSLFTKKRMLIIENIFLNKQENIFSELLSICSKNIKAEDNALIFNEDEIKISTLKAESKKFYQWLLKQPYVQEFKPLNNSQLLNFAQKEIARKKGKINPASLSLLISKTGNDLWRLNNEINKLIAAANGKLIDKDLITQLVKGDIEENIFALTDALVSKNNSLALRIFEEQLVAGLSEEYILSMLQRQIKLMLEIKKLQSNNINQEKDIAIALKVHPFVAKKSLQQSKGFNQLELENYWQALLELDFNNKRGQADIKSELYALIIN